MLLSLLFLCLSAEGVAVDPSKVEAVVSWERPKTVFEIRSFLGLAGYYRRFVRDFSKLAAPLTRLTRKGTPFTWSEDCEASFLELKTRLTTHWCSLYCSEVWDTLFAVMPHYWDLAVYSSSWAELL